MLQKQEWYRQKIKDESPKNPFNISISAFTIFFKSCIIKLNLCDLEVKMKIVTKQISSMEKIRFLADIPDESLSNTVMLKGESFSYQIIAYAEATVRVKAFIESALADCVTLYAVKDAIMDLPSYEDSDDDYITKIPGTMPDILMPLEEQNNIVTIGKEPISIWVKVDVPLNSKAGNFDINISLDFYENQNDKFSISNTLNIQIIDAVLPKSTLLYSQWIHVDCIATAHNVKIYSEEHWTLIDKYIKTASDLGVNTLMTPIITPPTDTAVGIKRPCVQLIKIEKTDDEYKYDFSLLKRWIDMCHKNSIEYFEMSYLFSQWGLDRTPNILIKENNAEFYMFDEKISARDKAYSDFLKSFLPQLVNFLKEEEVYDKCIFHISDEPGKEHLENYKYAYDIVTKLCPDCIFTDSISDIDFYEMGLIKTPIVAIDHIEPFLDKKVSNMWAYYCCAQGRDVSNRFLSMPSYRNRIIGLQLYKYDIKGFEHWGNNFYFSQLSLYEINPYITTSADNGFPSGDAFSVYPGKDGPILSLRAVIFKEALQDICLCRLLENYIEKQKVVKLLEKFAGNEITFKNYPRNSFFIPRVNMELKKIIAKEVSK